MIGADLVAQIVSEMRLPALSLFGGDWVKDTVSSCSLPAQALWFRLMLIMHDAKPYGHLVGANGQPLGEKQLIRQIGCSSSDLKKLRGELEAAGVPGRTGDKNYEPIFHGEVNGEEIDLSPLRIETDGVIYSRRMIRDQRLRVIRRLATILGKPKRGHLTGQTGDQNAGTRARMRPGLEKDSSLDSQSGDTEASRARELTPQQEAVKRIEDALEEFTAGFAVPDRSRIAKEIKTFGVDLILETIREEGGKSSLDHKSWSYLHQCIESRKRRPNVKRTIGGERRAEQDPGHQLTRTAKRVTLDDLKRTG